MKRKIAGLILSSFIAFISIAVLIVRVFVGYNFFTHEFTPFDYTYLKYFTSLSNFYNGFVFLYIFIISIIHFKEDDFVYTKFQKILALSAVSSVTITFFITIFFLNFSLPNPSVLYQYEILFFHIINPLLSITTFLLLLPGERIKLKKALFGVIPLLLYSICYTILVPTHIWDDFYNFSFGGHYWVVFIALPIVISISFGINYLLSFIEGKIRK